MKNTLLILFSLCISCSALAKPSSLCKGDEESLACIRSTSILINNEMKEIVSNIDKSIDNRAKFQVSQVKWLAYRRAYCKDFLGEEAAYAQGDGTAKIIESCQLNIDKNRLVELKKLNKVYSN